MGRGNVIDGLVQQIRATNGFDEVSSGTALAYDHKVLNQGVDRAAIVVVSGEPSTHERIMMGATTEMTWRLDVELYIRHNNDVVAARQDADTYVQNVVQRINDNPTLGGSAWDAFAESVRLEDEAFQMAKGKPPFLLEVVTVAAKEHLSGV